MMMMMMMMMMVMMMMMMVMVMVWTRRRDDMGRYSPSLVQLCGTGPLQLCFYTLPVQFGTG